MFIKHNVYATTFFFLGKPYPKYNLIDHGDISKDRDPFDWHGYERIYYLSQAEKEETLPGKLAGENEPDIFDIMKKAARGHR